MWAVFGSSLFPNNAKSSLLFSNRQKSCADLEPGPAPAKTHMRMGGYFLFGKFQFCFRFLGEFKVCFRKLDMEADMLDKIIETLDPKAQKHDQSRRQIDELKKLGLSFTDFSPHRMTSRFGLVISCLIFYEVSSWQLIVHSLLGVIPM